MNDRIEPMPESNITDSALINQIKQFRDSVCRAIRVPNSIIEVRTMYYDNIIEQLEYAKTIEAVQSIEIRSDLLYNAGYITTSERSRLSAHAMSRIIELDQSIDHKYQVASDLHDIRLDFVVADKPPTKS